MNEQKTQTEQDLFYQRVEERARRVDEVERALAEALAMRERFHGTMVRAKANMEDATRIYNDAVRLVEQADALVAEWKEVS
jgi:nucleoside 2-deoxyribosyltransferase